MIDENPFVKYINQQLGLPILLAEGIVSYFEYKTIPKNMLLLKAGDVCQNYMFIHKGIMRSFIVNSEHSEITTNFYTKNQVAIEQALFSIVLYLLKTFKQLPIVRFGLSILKK